MKTIFHIWSSLYIRLPILLWSNCKSCWRFHDEKSIGFYSIFLFFMIRTNCSSIRQMFVIHFDLYLDGWTFDPESYEIHTQHYHRHQNLKVNIIDIHMYVFIKPLKFVLIKFVIFLFVIHSRVTLVTKIVGFLTTFHRKRYLRMFLLN